MSGPSIRGSAPRSPAGRDCSSAAPSTPPSRAPRSTRDGWIAGGSGPDAFAAAAEKVRSEWSKAGREGEPRLAGLAYFSLGDEGEQHARDYLLDYYAWLGDEIAGMIAGSAATDAEAVQSYMTAYEGAGCDELFVFPSSSDAAQVDLLADAAGL